jgi:hypothetical protein
MTGSEESPTPPDSAREHQHDAVQVARSGGVTNAAGGNQLVLSRQHVKARRSAASPGRLGMGLAAKPALRIDDLAGNPGALC